LGTLEAQYTAAGAAFAALFSVYLLRNISLYPGIKSSYFVLPAVLLAYGSTFLIFMMLRLDYSRLVILSSGGAMIVWLYVAQLLIERGPPLRVGAVPVGSVAPLDDEPSLEVTWLREPRLDEDYDLLVADLRADLSDAWETFLADCALR